MGQNLFIVLVFLAIVYNLGAGLYYMLTDKGASDRPVDALTRPLLISAFRSLFRTKGEGTDTVKALTIRVGLSVALFIILMVLASLGIIKPH